MRFHAELLEIVGCRPVSGRKAKHGGTFLARGGHDLADVPCLETPARKVIACSLDGGPREHQAVANSKIEGVPEIAFPDLSMGLKPVEQFWAWPAFGIKGSST